MAPKDPTISLLRIWRESHQLSREQVAAVAGVSRQTVENWEKGQSTPRTEHVTKMCELGPGLMRALGLK
jgi:transcriptional regulator with XRE-family HTH domain